jgi:hypothetical protein
MRKNFLARETRERTRKIFLHLGSHLPMGLNMRFRWLAVLICLNAVGLSFVDAVHAQKSTARFLLWRPSAVSNAMGGVGTALHGDAFSAYYNPAGLAFSKSITLVGSFCKPLPFFDGVGHSMFGASLHSSSFGTIAASANIFWKDVQLRTDESGNEIGGFEETSWSGKISYATSTLKDVSVGVGIGLVRVNLAEIGAGSEKGDGKSGAVIFDFGFLFRSLIPQATWSPSGMKVSKGIMEITEGQQEAGISLGLSVLNVGPKITFIDHSQADPLPTRLTLGLAYWPISSDGVSLMLASDFEKELHESSTLDHVLLGGEARLFRVLALRAGYSLDTYGPKNSYSTLGAGIRLKFVSANVARYTRALIPSWHFDGTFSMEF